MSNRERVWTAEQVEYEASELAMYVDASLRRPIDMLHAYAATLRQQAALAQSTQGDKPVAWCAGLDATVYGFIDAKAWKEGEFTTPLYLHAERARVPARWRDSIEMARDEFQRINDMLLPECECDPCPECGRQPSECSGSDCAATCQCSTCDHCRVEDAIRGLDSLLATTPSLPEDAEHE